MTATDPNHDTPLIFPFLAPLYRKTHDSAYTALRVTSGGIMSWFGWEKLFNGDMPRDIELFQQLGLEPAVPLAYFTSGLEFFGGIAIALGLLTRPLSFMLFIQMIVILVMVMIPRGSGFQLSTVWLGVFAYLSTQGSGRWSVDRLIGRQF
ncbi:DoxX family protein [Ochrobactrum oryzae]|uniref:DoxX family protein n=1 Tax=Brucella oryzae TaxID=335286 RepID=A0A2S7J0K1_9HYPH|nr:DoxX family protein [Brucella oryzae]NKC22673.1 DoxX family protein [Brucella oryzae]PQA73768.1 hypothetical protein C3731_11025 [Brucella oryzae]